MTNEISISSIATILAAREQKLARELEAVKRAQRALMSVREPESIEQDYTGMRLADAIEMYLKERGAAADVNELTEALERGGAELGERRSTNVKIAVTSNRERFHWEGTKVALKAWEIERGAA